MTLMKKRQVTLLRRRRCFFLFFELTLSFSTVIRFTSTVVLSPFSSVQRVKTSPWSLYIYTSNSLVSNRISFAHTCITVIRIELSSWFSSSAFHTVRLPSICRMPLFTRTLPSNLIKARSKITLGTNQKYSCWNHRGTKERSI